MTNRLAYENSPYLLQHANNPVDWHPWDEEALEKARREDKPIFLSIGYAACHWCHVMERESFEDRETANFMNRHFVNIKVDREERPDLDSLYMNAVVAITGQGGWPMSVFLTPEGKPFFGGTYFPPVRRYNIPAFREVLDSVANLWQKDRQQILNSADNVTGHIQNMAITKDDPQALQEGKLEQAALALAQAYDWKHGGWGGAPKFPQPMAIEFLLRRAVRGDKLALDICTHALDAMAKGGMYDVLGGGFSRYSTDDNWLVPHFEKMLYDNAQLARVYLFAYLLTKQDFYRLVCEQTLDFVLREMTHPSGGFFSSLDADSEGQEGRYYVWIPGEIREGLADELDWAIFQAAYGIQNKGNFEGKTVFQRAISDEQLAEEFHISPQEARRWLGKCHARLLAVREQRIRPATDDKVLLSWNGLMCLAFSEASRYLGRADYLQVAIRNAHFLLSAFHSEDRLLRSWRNGEARHNAYLEDYASLILALVSLYQSNPDSRWFTQAQDLAEIMVERFQDPDGGFFDTRDDHETLVIRPKDLQDNATPSGSSLAANALLALAAYSGRGEWRDRVEAMLGAVQPAAARYPTAFAGWLSAIDFATAPVKEVAILGSLNDPGTQALAQVVWETYRPHLVAAISDDPANSESPALLEGKSPLNGMPTAFVCRNFTCLRPVTTPEELRTQLESPEPS